MSIFTESLQQEPKSAVTERQNLVQINEKVLQGLEQARRVAQGRPDLLKIVEEASQKWADLFGSVIIMAVGFSSMRLRSDEEILAKLIEGKEKSQQRKMSRLFGNKYSGMI